MSDSIPCRYPNKELTNESGRFKQSGTITRLHEIIHDILKRRRITYKEFTDMLVNVVINQHLSVSQLLTLRSKLLGLIFGSGRLVYDQFQFIMDMLGEDIPDDPEIDHFKNLGIGNDIRGKVFDRLTVLSCVGKKYDSMRYWRCRCQCGNVVEVAVNHLNSWVVMG